MTLYSSFPTKFLAPIRWALAWPVAILSLLIVAGGTERGQAQETFVAQGASGWAYWDRGGLPNHDWRNVEYNDSEWNVGTAPLGYGDSDLTTVVGYGSDGAGKFMTTYFRRSFIALNPGSYAELQLRLRRDDGAVVYLNGVEIIRDNLPSGDIEFGTAALAAVGSAEEDDYRLYTVASDALEDGPNLVAVEIHQASPASSDIVLDLELVGERVPPRIAIVAPVEGASIHPDSASLTVTVTDPVSNDTSFMVRFLGRAAGPDAEPDFTLIALPDTQYYVANKNGGTPEMFVAQTEWVLRERASRNIAFVTQLGDCVENGDNGGDDTEWRHATNALYRFENPLTTLLSDGLPYGFAPGNHDITGVSTATPVAMFFNQYFGVDHFAGRAYYGGHHGTNNNNNFELFSASGLDFIIVHLEYDTTPEPAVLSWAHEVLRTHANRRAILVSHYLIEKGNPAPFGAQGRAVYEALKDCPNLFLMLAGHVAGEGRRQDQFNGNTVHTLLADYQGRARGGDGWLRILEFSPGNNLIRVRTYSPVLDLYETDADSEFTFEYDMRRGEPFSEVGRVNGIQSGDQASMTWPNLASGSHYEWYVEVTDGTRTWTSPVATFTAEDGASQPIAEDPTDTDQDGQSDQAEALAGTDRRDPNSCLKMRAIEVAAGRVELEWSTVAGMRYQVCVKREMGESSWIGLSEEIEATGAVTQWSGPVPAGAGQSFYLIRVVP